MRRKPLPTTNMLLKNFVLLCLSLFLKNNVEGTSVNLTGLVFTQNNSYKFKFNCSSSSEPYPTSAEFLVDQKTVDTVKLVDGDCYDKLGLCQNQRCSCSKSGLSFSLFYPTSRIDELIVECEMSFEEPDGSLSRIRRRIKYDGRVFEEQSPSIKHVVYRDPVNDPNADEIPKNEIPSIINEKGNHTLGLSIGLTIGIMIICIIAFICIYKKPCRSDAQRNEAKTERFCAYHKPKTGVEEDNTVISDQNTATNPDLNHIQNQGNIISAEIAEKPLEELVKVEHIFKIERTDAKIKIIVLISSRRVVAAYQGEKNLKVFGANGHEFDITLDNEPEGITYIANNQIAVSVSEEIMLIGVNEDKYRIIQKLSLTSLGKLFKVTYDRNYLAVQVGDGTDIRIAILELNGKIKHIMPIALSAVKNMQMALCMEKGQLFIASEENDSVQSFDFKGTMLWNNIVSRPLEIIVSQIQHSWNRLIISTTDKYVYVINVTSKEKRKLVGIPDCLDNTLHIAHIFENGSNHLCFLGEAGNIDVYNLLW